MRQLGSADTALIRRQKFGAEIGVMPVGENQEVTIGNQLKAAILMASLPLSPLECGGGKLSRATHSCRWVIAYQSA